MRIIWAILFCVLGFDSFASCDNMNDPEMMYSRFYQLSFSDEGMSYEGHSVATVRAMSPSESNEAWGCLIKAASLHGCKALHILELYFRHGIGIGTFGIEKDSTKADAYKEELEKYCR